METKRKAKKKVTKRKATKKKVGRPSKKDSINLNTLRMLCEKGFTDKELAQVFGVCEVTINRYKNDEEFCKTLKEGKEFSDYQVEKSLYQRACGYEFVEETREAIVINGNPVDIDKMCKVKVTKKRMAQDPTSMIFWLKNRQPDRWRDKQEVEQSGEVIIKYDDGTNTAKGNPLR